MENLSEHLGWLHDKNRPRKLSARLYNGGNFVFYREFDLEMRSVRKHMNLSQTLAGCCFGVVFCFFNFTHYEEKEKH